MKIVQLDIQGFRSLKNVTWRPGDLNVVIGPNGSGKSNLLRMLELISAAAQGKLSDYVQAEGGFGAIVWDGQAPQIVIRLTTSAVEVRFSQENVFYQVELFRTIGSYKIANELLGPSFVITDSSDPSYIEGPFAHIDRNGSDSNIFNDDHLSMAVPEEVVSETESLLSLAASPFTGNTLIPVYQKQLTSLSIYQDIRTDQSASIRQAPVSRLEQRVAPDGQNLINVLHTLYTNDRKFKQDINDAMFAAFGEAFDELIFGPAGDQRIQMRLRWKTLKRDQPTADLSDGTLRFLFLITLLASPDPPPLIAIDEPETGLHPSMLPIIAEFAAEAATRTQVIFTTHSDQFLSAFRDTRPTVTIAKWEDGETTLTTLDDSELEYWLKDYSLGKMFRSGELENLAS